MIAIGAAAADLYPAIAVAIIASAKLLGLAIAASMLNLATAMKGA